MSVVRGDITALDKHQDSIVDFTNKYCGGKDWVFTSTRSEIPSIFVCAAVDTRPACVVCLNWPDKSLYGWQKAPKGVIERLLKRPRLVKPDDEAAKEVQKNDLDDFNTTPNKIWSDSAFANGDFEKWKQEFHPIIAKEYPNIGCVDDVEIVKRFKGRFKTATNSASINAAA
ncbi:MAG: hypothetical protein MMC23_007124 [Stictis urceolatum]|nr:hypothetical protein [Stictis urceolata]